MVVPRGEASSTLSYLLGRKMVDESLKIKSDGENVHIPLREWHGAEHGSNVRMEEFEHRQFHSSPQSRIREELETRGLDPDHAPEKWVRLGSSITARFPDVERSVKVEVASACADILRVKSVYEVAGRIKGTYREPEARLLYGPGGEVTHLENGIKFTMDPERVMFSPGNVNIRTSVRNMDLKGKIALDMFAGIGYFSLGLAKYAGLKEIHSCEINPISYGYLERNIRANRLDSRIVPHLGDSRIVAPRIKADVVIMGNFLSFSYLPHAIMRLRPGGSLLMHDLVPTENLGRYKYDLYRRLRMYGWKGSIVEQRTVKSFAPHMWHIYINAIASDNRQ